jgi:hypothetical protein
MAYGYTVFSYQLSLRRMCRPAQLKEKLFDQRRVEDVPCNLFDLIKSCQKIFPAQDLARKLLLWAETKM